MFMLCALISDGPTLVPGVRFNEHSLVDKKGNCVVGDNLFSYDNKRTNFNLSSGKVAVIQGLTDYIVV